MKRFALPIAILAVVSAACGSSGAVGVGTVKKLVPLPKVLPNSVVRIDPRTLKPLQVVSVGSAPDLVVASGGFVWVTHHVLRDVSSGALRNRGDRKLTQVNPATGKVTDVGNGLAPCGLAADPSGDVWVANCFEPGLGQTRDHRARQRQDARFHDLAGPGRLRLLPGPRLWGRLDMGVGRRCRSRGDAGQPKDRREEGDSTRPFRRRTCVVQGARQSLGRQLRRGQPHAAARRNRSQRNRRSCCCQSRLPGRRRRHRVGRRLVESAGRAAPRGRIAQTAHHPPTRSQLLRRGLGRRGRCRLRLGDHSTRRRAVADQSTNQRRDPRQHAPPAGGRHRECKPGMGHCRGEVTDHGLAGGGERACHTSSNMTAFCAPDGRVWSGNGVE